MKNLVILSAARTPIGSFLGKLSSLSAPALGSAAIRAAVARSGADVGDIEQVVFGNVLQAGIGQAPARQASLGAGIPNTVPCVTVHKVCGSGMRAVMDVGNAIRVGEYEVAVAGGMESMSNAPYLLEKARTGLRMGNGTLVDSMIKDGLWDPYNDTHMGNCAELCVGKYAFTRQEQDAFSLESYRRAQAATKSGLFADEIAPVEVPQKKGDPVTVDADEEPFAAPLDKMPSLKPAFQKDGTVTAANSSKINDGAAALVVTSEEKAKAKGWKPIARIVAYTSVAQAPEWFTTAPVGAIQKLLGQASIGVADVDLFEINEAFAAVAMAAIRELSLDPAKVNVRGGAVALGHPIGASGARILTTLIHALRKEGKKRGIAAICIGGGEAAAMLVENGLTATRFDLVAGGVPRFRAEAPWAWRLLRRHLAQLPADRRTEVPGRAPTVADAAGDAPIVLVHADPEAYLVPEAAVRLVEGLAGRPELDLLLPVSNEPWCEEARRAPPFAYLTPTLLSEAAAFIAAAAGPIAPLERPASPVYAVRRALLASQPPGSLLERLPADAWEAKAAIDPGAYLHRYGAMDASSREDLAARVPAGARVVLDVGCSRGATAAALRARGVGRIVGIEPDPDDAAAAAEVYDEVLATRLEAVGADFAGRFDAILFGDVLEHLEDPSDALVRVRPWLARGGLLVVSVPNLGHWAVVEDLVRGRFDYVPYSLLSGTHIRFFTRKTLVDLFEASGYRVREIDTVVLPASPAGGARLQRLRAFPEASPDLEVSEFLAVAAADC